MLSVEIDVAAEKLRLQKEIDKNTKELEKITSKLANPAYAERAPKDLVERDTTRVKELEKIVAGFGVQLAKLG